MICYCCNKSMLTPIRVLIDSKKRFLDEIVCSEICAQKAVLSWAADLFDNHLPGCSMCGGIDDFVELNEDGYCINCIKLIYGSRIPNGKAN